MAAEKTKVAKAAKSVASELVDGIREGVGDEAAVQLLGSAALALKIKGVISTQCIGVDSATGRGGIPLGRLSILHGREGSGKTTLALQIVAEVQRQGGMAVYLDQEYKLDPDYAAALGVNIKELIISQASYLERVFEVAYHTVSMVASLREKYGSQFPVLLVLDSMNSCITKAEFEGDYDQIQVASPARVFSKCLAKLIPEIHKHSVALLFVSQVRSRIGVMYGDNEEIAGGHAPKHYASLIMHIKRIGSEKINGEKVGNKIVVECKKNQIAPPFKKTEEIIWYGKGFDNTTSLLRKAVALKLVSKEGTWMAYGDERLGQGESHSVAAMRKHPEIITDLTSKVREVEGW